MVELIAKTNPQQTLIEHTEKVVSNCKYLSELFRIPEEHKERLLLACALHDVGKATISFQRYIRGETSKSFPHALASLPVILILEKVLYGDPLLGSLAVVTHHSPLTVNSFERYQITGPQSIGYLKEDIYRFLEDVETMLNLDSDLKKIVREHEKLWLDKKPYDYLKILKKKIILDARFRDYTTLYEFSTIKTILNLSDWFASGKNKRNALFLPKSSKEFLREFFSKRGYSYKDFQKQCLNIFEKDIFLKAPTGTGKTESMLLWSNNRKIIYLLPTQTTVNSMWQRLISIYGKDAVGLSHGRAQLILRKNLDEFDDEVDELYIYSDLLLNSIFGKPVVVATLDQYLLSALHGRHWENKLFLIRHSDMILDEIHSYDGYVLGLTIASLKKYPPHSLALGSATFPKALQGLFKKELGDKTEIVAENNLWERKRHRIISVDDDIFSAKNEIIECAKKGNNVLVVLNTISRAQDLYREIDYDNKILLHSRFVYRDREKKEEFLKKFNSKNKNGKNKEGYILISTQVVEVSLDISFNVLYTELAPIDSLIQRFGRVNRYGEKGIADVYVFLEWDDKSEAVYGKEVLEKSRDLLYKVSTIPKERELIELVDSLYEYLFNTHDFKNLFEEGYEKVKEFNEALGIQTISLHDDNLKKRFFTRLSKILREDIVPWDFREEAYYMIENKEKWRIPEIMVSIPSYWLKNTKIEYITPSIAAAEIVYSSELGALEIEKML